MYQYWDSAAAAVGSGAVPQCQGPAAKSAPPASTPLSWLSLVLVLLLLLRIQFCLVLVLLACLPFVAQLAQSSRTLLATVAVHDQLLPCKGSPDIC